MSKEARVYKFIFYALFGMFISSGALNDRNISRSFFPEQLPIKSATTQNMLHVQDYR